MNAHVATEHGKSKAGTRKSKRADPWFKRYPDDFFKGTRALSLEARGAYNDVLDLIYINDGPIADDDFQIACALRVKVRKWQTIKSQLVDAGKLILRGGTITNERCEEEIKQRQITRKNYASRGSSRDHSDGPKPGNRNDRNGGRAHNGSIDGPYTRGRASASDTDTDPEKKEGLTKEEGSCLGVDDYHPHGLPTDDRPYRVIAGGRS